MNYYLSLILTLWSLNCLAQSSKFVEQFLSTPGFENSSIGICVKDISGKEIISYNKELALVPASTMKILTTASALEMLGEGYRFKTSLFIDKKDKQKVVVRGTGDPTLGSEYLNIQTDSFLNNWVEAIQKAIDNKQPLQIEIDDSYFGYDGVSSKWLQEDLGNYYAAGAYGVSIFDNTYKVFFNTVNANPFARIVKTEPEMKDIVFLNTMTTNHTGKDNGYINGEPFSNQRKLVGDIPANRKNFSIKGDIPDPGLYLGQALAQRLELSGIKVDSAYTPRKYFYVSDLKTSSYANLSKDEIEIYTQYSSPLKSIVRVVNERSNNHYSEHLIRAIGRHLDPEITDIPSYDALDRGIVKTKEFWTQKGINTNSLFMYDGCGLAPSNRISSELLCDILVYMNEKSIHKESFFKSLPKAGSEGTVKNLLKGTRLAGNVFVKSGSIANVQCFAGYYVDQDKTYVFSVMVNNYNSPRKQVVEAIEKLLLNIF